MNIPTDLKKDPYDFKKDPSDEFRYWNCSRS